MKMYLSIEKRAMQVFHHALQRTSVFRDEVERHHLASGRQNLLVRDMLAGCPINTDDSPEKQPLCKATEQILARVKAAHTQVRIHPPSTSDFVLVDVSVRYPGFFYF